MKVAALLLLAAWALSAQPPAIDDSLNLRSAGSPVISDDGRYVAWTVSQPDWDDNENRTQIWLWSRDTGRSIQITFGKKSASLPAFSPDSRRLAFLTSRSGKDQVWVIPVDGGEAAQLTENEGGVNGFAWSPDSRSIAYTSVGPVDKESKDRKEKYGELEVVRQDHRYTHLYLVPAPLELPKPSAGEALTSGALFSVSAFDWSPDGSRIAFSAQQEPGLTAVHTADLFVLTIDGKTVKKIVERQGADSHPLWSPDGKLLAFTHSPWQPFDCCPNNRLGLVPAAGGEVRFVAESFDENVDLVRWTANGMYFAGFEKARPHLYRLDPATRRFAKVMDPGNLFPFAPSLSRDAHWMAFSAGAADRLPEIYVSPLDRFEPQRLTDMTAQLANFTLATREMISWKSSDGALIEGVLIKPCDFDPARQYPLLVVVHGGPTGIDLPILTPDRYYPIEQFVAKGALVLRPNYRGSAGYGEKFRSLNVRNLGVGDAWDVESGVDALIARGIVDPNRLGVMGWSQGGYISAFLATSSRRFQAASVGAGISDWMTYYVNTDITWFTRRYLRATPWDDPEVYRKTSPISYVQNAKTPTLIQHGENDKRVPIPNAYQLRQALEDQGVPVRMVVYKGFGHGINKPKQMRHVMEENLRWFSHWVWGEEGH